MEDFVKQLSRAKQQKLQATSKGMYTKQVLPNGKTRVTGGKRLKSSGAYSKCFGVTVAKLLKKKVVTWFSYNWVVHFWVMHQAVYIYISYVTVYGTRVNDILEPNHRVSICIDMQ